MRPQLPVTVEILGRRVEIGRIGLSVDGDVTGSLHQMLGRVIQRRVHREHPHEGPALFDVGVGVVEIHPVRVGRLQVRITVADVLGVRYVVNALQVGDRRAVGVGRDEEPQRVLAVDVQLAHHKIGHVVVGVLDLLGIVAHDLSVEGRTLVVDVGDERVALFRKTESGTYALRQVAALVGVRQQGIKHAAREGVVVGNERSLVALLRIVGNPVLEAHLRVFGHRLGVGETAAQAVRRRRRQVAQVTQFGVVRRVPDAGHRVDRRPVGLGCEDVRPRVRIVRVVRVAERSVKGDRAAVLAQLGPVDGARPDVVAVAQGVAEVVRAAVTAAAVGGCAVLPSGRAAPRIVGLVAEARADHQVLVLGDLPLQTGVEPVVVALRVGIAVGRQRIGDHRGLVPFLHRRTVLGIGVVEEIAALERHLIALAPRIGVVDADGVDRRHAALRAHHVIAHAAATSATAARDAQNVLEREILLVDVVEQADE